MADILFHHNIKILAVADSRATIYSKEGLDPHDLSEYKLKNGSLAGYKKGKEILADELFGLNVDIIIPAALENVITKDNAGSIKAKCVLEVANGPTTPEADIVLTKKSIDVIPDILANAGGVTVSYFEWVQNRSRFYWTIEEIEQKLSQKMSSAFHDVYNFSVNKNITMRQAAYALAINRIGKAVKNRGILN